MLDTQHDWIEDVLEDLIRFTEKSSLFRTKTELKRTLLVAASEIAEVEIPKQTVSSNVVPIRASS